MVLRRTNHAPCIKNIVLLSNPALSSLGSTATGSTDTGLLDQSFKHIIHFTTLKLQMD